MPTPPNYSSSLLALLTSVSSLLSQYTNSVPYNDGGFRSYYATQVSWDLESGSNSVLALSDDMFSPELNEAVHDFSSQLAATLQKYDYLAQRYYPPPATEISAFYQTSSEFIGAYYSRISSNCDILTQFSNDVAMAASLFSSIASKSPASYMAVLHTPFFSVATCATSSAPPSSPAISSTPMISTTAPPIDPSTCAVLSSVEIGGKVYACKVACTETPNVVTTVLY